MDTRSRQPRGQSNGGQFAPSTNPESKVDLNDEFAGSTVNFMGVRYWKDKWGNLHRDDGPAMILPDGSRLYFSHGRKHRKDGPAEIRSDGTELWFDQDVLSRSDGGPAISNADGSKVWAVHGRKHREDGPAVIDADGTPHWWIDNREITQEAFDRRATMRQLEGAQKS